MTSMICSWSFSVNDYIYIHGIPKRCLHGLGHRPVWPRMWRFPTQMIRKKPWFPIQNWTFKSFNTNFQVKLEFTLRMWTFSMIFPRKPSHLDSPQFLSACWGWHPIPTPAPPAHLLPAGGRWSIATRGGKRARFTPRWVKIGRRYQFFDDWSWIYVIHWVIWWFVWKYVYVFSGGFWDVWLEEKNQSPRTWFCLGATKSLIGLLQHSRKIISTSGRNIDNFTSVLIGGGGNKPVYEPATCECLYQQRWPQRRLLVLLSRWITHTVQDPISIWGCSSTNKWIT